MFRHDIHVSTAPSIGAVTFPIVHARRRVLAHPCARTVAPFPRTAAMFGVMGASSSFDDGDPWPALVVRFRLWSYTPRLAGAHCHGWNGKLV